MSKVTIVTGIWDIKRDTLSEGWNRSFEHYLNNLEKLLKYDGNIIIYIEEKYKKFVEERRNTENTQIIVRELDWFINNGDLLNKINNIRTKPEWYNQVSWLKNSTQAKLEYYNLIVMSKMFLLNDATYLDKFNSEYFVWVDGALTNTVSEGYFTTDNIFNKLEKYLQKFMFVCFPYDGKIEIHGFKYSEMCKYSEANVSMVARGGIFGGKKNIISKINSIYYTLLNDTLSNGLMGTEESIFTIMTYKYSEYINYFDINGDGLLWKFFDDVKNDVFKPKMVKMVMRNDNDINNIALYVLTFNSPKQFEKLCVSFEKYDRNFLDKPKKFLLNNSTNKATNKEYKKLCKKYDFVEIKKDNIGICGGRQFIAEHANDNGFDYHMFFEDDMFFYGGDDLTCKNGFIRKINNLYDKTLNIIWKENLDFLKLNFTEFFGDNTKQWAWHNVPEKTRAELFPEQPIKYSGDYNLAPNQKFNHIKSHKGLPYTTGNIYYCNWPQIVSKQGNKKMFLDIKWGLPFEQTWMSHIYQEGVKGNINSGVLLATPTEHDRFDFYDAEERKEN